MFFLFYFKLSAHTEEQKKLTDTYNLSFLSKGFFLCLIIVSLKFLTTTTTIPALEPYKTETTSSSTSTSLSSFRLQAVGCSFCYKNKKPVISVSVFSSCCFLAIGIIFTIKLLIILSQCLNNCVSFNQIIKI